MSFPGLRDGKPEMALELERILILLIEVWVDEGRQEPRLRMETWGVKLTKTGLRWAPQSST